MPRKTVVPGAAFKIDALIQHLEDRYKARQFEVQVLQIQDGALSGKLFQMKEGGDNSWLSSVKNMSGLTTAATLKLIAQGQDLEMEVLGGKWLDKVAVGAVSLVVLWPLIITSGIGAWRQNTLLDELYESASLFLAGGSGRIPATPMPPPAPPRPMTHCPSCGQIVTAAMKFCGDCGYKLA